MVPGGRMGMPGMPGGGGPGGGMGGGGMGDDDLSAIYNANLPSPIQRGARERELLQAVGQLGDANEMLNERAVAVMTRMGHKLTGKDFGQASVAPPPPVPSLVPAPSGNGLDRTTSGMAILGPVDARDAEPGLSVKTQVQRLVAQATSHENLCQSYIGWCPFW
eukprot:TRINITY_DN12017_c1_g1_i1.p1 TRINITY_DN12017_c1_g1~~TRINITY_DN12017_c1_g1_i1.p1  ORF type:complete len:182 (+),score=41.26 TRINITY_DN12017_c1_g1_i1:60-548(+)